jgi:hypothetical protein
MQQSLIFNFLQRFSGVYGCKKIYAAAKPGPGFFIINKTLF